MRKGLTILGALFIIIIVFSETLLPWLASATLQTRMNQRLSTSDAQVAVDSRPGILLLRGQVQQLHAVAHQAKVGQVYFREISMSGENVRLRVGDLLQAGKVALQSADKLLLKGVVDEENLQEAVLAGGNIHTVKDIRECVELMCRDPGEVSWDISRDRLDAGLMDGYEEAAGEEAELDFGDILDWVIETLEDRL